MKNTGEQIEMVIERREKSPVRFKRSWLVGLLNDRANLKMDEVLGESLAGPIPIWEMAEAILADLTELNLIKTEMIEDDRASGEASQQDD